MDNPEHAETLPRLGAVQATMSLAVPMRLGAVARVDLEGTLGGEVERAVGADVDGVDVLAHGGGEADVTPVEEEAEGAQGRGPEADRVEGDEVFALHREARQWCGSA